MYFCSKSRLDKLKECKSKQNPTIRLNRNLFWPFGDGEKRILRVICLWNRWFLSSLWRNSVALRSILNTSLKNSHLSRSPSHGMNTHIKVLITVKRDIYVSVYVHTQHNVEKEECVTAFCEMYRKIYFLWKSWNCFLLSCEGGAALTDETPGIIECHQKSKKKYQWWHSFRDIATLHWVGFLHL